MLRFLKRAALFLAIFICVAVAGLLIAKAWWDSHFFDGYNPDYPLNVTIRSDRPADGYRRIEFTYDTRPGEPVPSILALPKHATGPLPCIIFLHGIGQDKTFLDEIAARFVRGGFAIVSFDQLTRGERRLPNQDGLEGLFALRRRAASNVIDTRRLIDYLDTRDDIAHNRIYLIGASFGAITGANAAAFDTRIRAVVLTYGGGNLNLLLHSAAAKKEAGAFVGPLAWFGAFFFSPADPIKYINRIAPRPLLVQNGTHDTIVPYKSGRALYEAASQPKQFVAYDSDHIGLDKQNVIHVLNDSIKWLHDRDKAFTTRAAASPAAHSGVPVNQAASALQ